MPRRPGRIAKLAQPDQRTKMIPVLADAGLRIRCKLVAGHGSRHEAYTLVELLAFTLMVAITAITGKTVATRYGTLAGVGAGIVAALISICLVVLLYRWSWHRDRQQLKELREKYRGIYRVIKLPPPQASIIQPQGAEVRIGDYGWEAGPDRRDGLIYLQGLTPDWTVVWHSGFRPDQVERVAEKTTSQYDYWAPYWAKPPSPPPCPFPVTERETMTWGCPHHSHRYFQNPVWYRLKPKEQTDN